MLSCLIRDTHSTVSTNPENSDTQTSNKFFVHLSKFYILEELWALPAVLTKTHFAQFCYYMWISSELYLCHMLSVLLILYASIIGLWLNPMQIFAGLLLYLHLSRASFLPIINERCVHFATQHGAPSAESKVKSTTRSKSQRIVGWIKTSIQYRTLCYLLACSTVVSQSINRNVGSVAGD